MHERSSRHRIFAGAAQPVTLPSFRSNFRPQAGTPGQVSTTPLTDHAKKDGKSGKHSKKGVPDIILIKKGSGQFIGLEVKREDGKLSPEQREFERDSKAHGAEYHVVRSIDDVQALGL
jgi:hypothetical protein